MMKKITLFIIILTGTFVFAQSSHTIDFEPAGTGSGWNWTASDVAPSFSEITNPVSGGINTSNKVVEFIAYTTDQNWALCHTSDDGEFTFDVTNSTVKIMVYKPTISNVAIKFEGLSPAIEIKVANTVVNQWEELVFDFSGSIGNTYSKIVIIPDFVEPYVNGKDRTTDNTLYFDNIIVPNGVYTGPLPEPAAAHSAPVHDETNNQVISIFSDPYTDLSGSNFNPNWGQSTVATTESLSGNSVLKYSGLNYQGTNLGSTDGGVPQDVSSTTHLHVDFWTPNATTLKFFVLDQSAGEVSYDVTSSIATETWVSVEIPLSHFSGNGENLMDIHQLKVEGNGTVWLDNLYFYNETSLSNTDFKITDFKIAPNPAKNYWRINSPNQNIQSIQVFNALGKNILSLSPNTTNEVEINASNFKTGLYFAQIKTRSGTNNFKLVKQ